MEAKSVCHLEECDVEIYFEIYIYAQNHPNCFRRYSSVQLSDPLCDYVSNYEGPRDVLYKHCGRIITRIVETHRMLLTVHGGTCSPFNVSHSPLYVCARMAARCGLPDSVMVMRLVSEIYRCDRDFRRFMMGAYMDPQECIGVCGAHPVFSNKEEGLAAYRYFLHHANEVKKIFFQNSLKKRMVDVNFRSSDCLHPAERAIAVDSYSTFKLLVEHGTDLTESRKLLWPTLEEEAALSKTRWDWHKLDKERYRRMYLRGHPWAPGHSIPCLLELCRVVIRRQLHANFVLPNGIKDLPLPDLLKKYINLECD